MPMSQLDMYRQVIAGIRKIEEDRVKDDSERCFTGAREAMLMMHCEWQDLMTAVKMHDIDNHAARAALGLAAIAIKFAADLGDPVAMRLIVKGKDRARRTAGSNEQKGNDRAMEGSPVQREAAGVNDCGEQTEKHADTYVSGHQRLLPTDREKHCGHNTPVPLRLSLGGTC